MRAPYEGSPHSCTVVAPYRTELPGGGGGGGWLAGELLTRVDFRVLGFLLAV